METIEYHALPWQQQVLVLARHNLGQGRPTTLLLEGPPGASKTSTAYWLSREIGAPVEEFNLTSSMMAEDLLYSPVIVNGNQVEYVISAMGRAFQVSASQPVILVLDEIDKARERVEERLLRVLETWEFALPQGTQVKGNPANMVVVATSNGARELWMPTRRRFLLRVKTGFPAEAEQVRILTGCYECGERAARLVCRIAARLRAISPEMAPTYPEMAEVIRMARVLRQAGYAHSECRDILGRTLWKGKAMPDLKFNWAAALWAEA